MIKVHNLDKVAGRKVIKFKTRDPLPQLVWLDEQSGVELKRMRPNEGTVHQCNNIVYKEVNPSEFESSKESGFKF